MSATLVMYPVRANAYLLSDQLRFVLQKEYNITNELVFDSTALDFLRGLKAAGISDAEKVIEYINKYGIVQLRWEY